eukprot:142233_1
MPRRSSKKAEEPQDMTELFELLELLGEGSYGSVYKALYKKDGTFVAIKIVPVENDITDLQKEINILQKCKSEYIVNYRGSFRDRKNNNVWIVMEYCGAGSVSDLVTICRKTLTEEEIAVVCREMLFGLKYLHSKRLIHRDIKSGNVLLNADGHAKLADFGVSAQLTSTISKRRTVIGTPYWMAPEVLRETEYNNKADMWSLGITVIEMATGNPPHASIHPMRAIFLIPNKPAPTLPHPERYTSEIVDFVTKCCNKNPDARPSATELLKHPFIKHAKSRVIIQELVHQCMPEIQAFRENAENEESDDEDRSISGSSDNASANYDAGTVVMKDRQAASGTVVFTQQDTMVVRKPTNDSQWETPSASGTMVKCTSSDDGDSVPAYMKQFQTNESAPPQRNATAPKPSDTIRKYNTNTAESADSFMDYFRTGKKIPINKSATLEQLEQQLIDVNRSYQRERESLDDFYKIRRNEIRSRISTMRKQSAR